MSNIVQHLFVDAQYFLQRLQGQSPHQNLPQEDIESPSNFQSIDEILPTHRKGDKQPRRIQKTTQRRKFSSPFQFHKFLNLPCELRLQIWEHAFSARYELGRKFDIVVIADQSRLYANPSFLSLSTTSNWDTILPPLLQACQESRAIVLERFPYALPTSGNGGEALLHFTNEDTFHIHDFQIMTAPESFIAFGSLSKPLRRMRNRDLAPYLYGIQYLSIDFDATGVLDKVFPGDYILLLTLFPNLKELLGQVHLPPNTDAQNTAILSQTLRDLESAFPDFWKRVQRRYLVREPNSKPFSFELKFEIRGSDVEHV